MCLLFLLFKMFLAGHIALQVGFLLVSRLGTTWSCHAVSILFASQEWLYVETIVLPWFTTATVGETWRRQNCQEPTECFRSLHTCPSTGPFFHWNPALSAATNSDSPLPGASARGFVLYCVPSHAPKGQLADGRDPSPLLLMICSKK